PQNLLVSLISFQHARARIAYFYRERILVQFEDGDVLEFVALLFSHVNLAARKLIDHLIAAKERHRIARSKIENSAAQLFLGSRRSLHVEPETDHRAEKRDPCE